MGAPKPFLDIETTLLNDETDASSIELDGIMLCSCNEWEGECPQTSIHETLSRVGEILADYRDGKLAYVTPNGEVKAAPLRGVEP